MLPLEAWNLQFLGLPCPVGFHLQVPSFLGGFCGFFCSSGAGASTVDSVEIRRVTSLFGPLCQLQNGFPQALRWRCTNAAADAISAGGPRQGVHAHPYPHPPAPTSSR